MPFKKVSSDAATIKDRAPHMWPAPFKKVLSDAATIKGRAPQVWGSPSKNCAKAADEAALKF